MILPGLGGKFWAAGAPGGLRLLIHFHHTVLSKQVRKYTGVTSKFSKG